MKPRNFPGRKALRRARAQARLEKKPVPIGDPAVADIRFRVGGRNRGPDGVPTSLDARHRKGGAS